MSIPDYTKKAIENYQKKFDRFTISLPKGTKDHIKELTGLSANQYINKLVAEDLERLEKNK